MSITFLIFFVIDCVWLFEASRKNSERITLENILATAKVISENRLEDLHKEYRGIFTGLSQFTTIFSNGKTELTFEEASSIIERLMRTDTKNQEIQQDLQILEDPKIVIRLLYSIGFFG